MAKLITKNGKRIVVMRDGNVIVSDVSSLQELKAELQTAREELNSNYAPDVSAADITDVNDVYQAKLEYNWWLADQLELIKRLETQILLLS